MRVKDLFYQDSNKYTFVVQIVAGDMLVNRSLTDNEDVIEAAWVSIHDTDKWDDFTLPMLKRYQKQVVTNN